MTPTEPVQKSIEVAASNEQGGRILRGVAIGLACTAAIVLVLAVGFSAIIGRIDTATSYQVDRGQQGDCIRTINTAYELAKKDNDLAITAVVNIALEVGEGPALDEANRHLRDTSADLAAAAEKYERVLDICPPVEPPEFAD